MSRINVYGPYKHGRRWRLRIRERISRGEYRERPSPGFETKAEALALKAELEQQACAFTIDDALERYEQHRRGLGHKPTSIDTTTYRLRGFLAGVGNVLELTARRCRELYRDYQKGHAVTTHRGALREVKTFATWLIEVGQLKRNPLTGIKPVGKVRRRKQQLTVTETRALLETAAAVAAMEPEPTDYRERTRRDGAVATLLVLMTGMRASEVIGLELRHVDELGQRAWVFDSKTDAGDRPVPVPEPAWSALLDAAKRARGRGDKLVFDRSRHWVRYHVERLCKVAGVTIVTAHGLRGTLASLATGAGIVTDAIAELLGHASTAVTRDHYTTPEAFAVGVQRRGLQVLQGGQR
jgi:integrase